MTMMQKEKFVEIAQEIAKAGGRMYLVGGAVRDMALKKKPHDMDFCVTGLSIEEFKKLFPKARLQGKDFPVFIIHHSEFALARKERKIGERHTDFEILADKSITIEEDLARRDLTINAMAIDYLTGELVDPFHGLEDLKNKVLRMTTKAYGEDPLRVYRTARFAAKFGYEIEENTLKMMESMREELPYLSVERVLMEFRKALLTEHPSIFFEVLRKANILEVHFPEIAKLIGIEQPVLYHPEGDAYTHTLEVLERTAKRTPNGVRYMVRGESSKKILSLGKDSLGKKLPLEKKKRYHLVDSGKLLEGKETKIAQRELIRFCALVHDFGKIATPREEWPHHIGHEEAGVPIIQDFCKRLKLPKLFEKAGILTSNLHMKAGRYDSLKPSTKVRMFETIASSKSLSFEGMEIVASADSKKNISFAKVATRVLDQKVTPEMQEKCMVNGKYDYQKVKNLLQQERVELLRSIEKKNEINCGWENI